MAFSTFDGSLLYLALPAVGADFKARLPDLSNLLAVSELAVLGMLPLAALADRAGRRGVVVIGVVGFSLADLASAFAPSLAALAGTRLLAACFEGIVATVAAVMVIEEVPAHHRALAVSALTMGSGLGQGATLFLYPLVAPRWRLLYALGGLGLVAALAIWRWLPESRVWSLARPSPDVFRRLLRHPWRRRLLVLGAAAGLGALAYTPGGLFVAFFASRSLSLSPGLISAVMLVSGPLSGIGFLAGGWLADRQGRRPWAVVLSIASALVAALTFLGGVAAYWAGNLGWSLVGGAAAPVLTA